MENAALFAKYLDGHHWEQHPTIYAERFAQYLIDRNFKGKLVDLGCGTGRDIAVFHRLGIKAVGLDVSGEELSKARSNHPECEFKQGTIEYLPYFSRQIGAYFMINVIHYVDQGQALDEIRRTLDYGGLLFVHFNLLIVDAEGNVDYAQQESVVNSLIQGWTVLERQVFQRVDARPHKHTHTILELILSKPSP